MSRFLETVGMFAIVLGAVVVHDRSKRAKIVHVEQPPVVVCERCGGMYTIPELMDPRIVCACAPEA